jgi:hypothetical protein
VDDRDRHLDTARLTVVKTKGGLAQQPRTEAPVQAGSMPVPSSVPMIMNMEYLLSQTLSGISQRQDQL